MRLKSTSKPNYRSILSEAAVRPWGIAVALCTFSTVAFGQATILPATPAAPESAPAPSALPQQSGTINLNFVDVPVVQLITMIAQQGNVGIIIGPDVSNETVIPYINLKNETPESAIKKATMAAGLTWEKIDSTTFMIGKSLPNVPAQRSGTDSGLPQLPFSATPTPNAPATLPGIIANANANGTVYTPMPELYDMDVEEVVDDNKSSYAMIKVHNVRPDIIAYWIDPAHHATPPEFLAAQRGIARQLDPHPVQSAVAPGVMAQLQGSGGYGGYNYNPYASPARPISYGAYNQFNQPYFRGSAQFGGGRNNNNNNNRNGNNNSGGMLEAPKGIGTIVSIDAQNALLVYGTAEGVAQLRQIIDFLDRPIRQVEIEAQFVDIGTTAARAFGLSFSSQASDDDSAIMSNLGTIPSGQGGTSLTARFGSYQATLKALVTNKKARIVNSPRVTTLNNLTAYLFSSTSTPIVLSSSTSGIGGQVGSQQNAFFLTTSIGLVVTPTINNDDTITVFLTPQVQVQTPVQTSSSGPSGDDDDNSNSDTASSIPSFTSQSLTTVATVKDGDTIVLGGLRTKNVSYTESSIPILSKIPIIGGLFKSRSKTNDDRELVIFLTARILHRTDDLAPLPGT